MCVLVCILSEYDFCGINANNDFIKKYIRHPIPIRVTFDYCGIGVYIYFSVIHHYFNRMATVSITSILPELFI